MILEDINIFKWRFDRVFMPEDKFEYDYPSRFNDIPKKDAALILVDIKPTNILFARDNLIRDGRNFYPVWELN